MAGETMSGRISSASSGRPVTSFSGLSDKELYSLYSDRSWSRMSLESKTELLQETANRETLAYGDSYAVKVRIDDLEPGTLGVQNGREVTLSRSAVENGKLYADYKGRTAEMRMQDSNWQSLETVLHEVRHTWQDEVAQGRIEADRDLQDTFASNGFTVSEIDGKKGVNYMYGVKDGNMYLLNPTEADANIYAQGKTSEIIGKMKAEGTADLTMDVYAEKLERSGYGVQLQRIREETGKQDIDSQVAQVLKNCHFKTDEPVDADIDKAVKAEMEASYRKLESEGVLLEAEANHSVISFEEGQDEGVFDNNPEDFTGEVPTFDASVFSSDETGVLDNNPGDFTGDVPSVETSVTESPEGASASSESADGSSDGGMEVD